MPFSDGDDLFLLRGAGQPDRRRRHLLDGGVAADPGEDEHDGRQQRGGVKGLDHVRPADEAERAGPAGTAPRPVVVTGSMRRAAVVPAAVRGLPLALSRSTPRAAGIVPDVAGLGLRHLDQGRVHLGLGPPGQCDRGRGVTVEQVVQPSADQDVLEERDRSPFGDHHGQFAPHL